MTKKSTSRLFSDPSFAASCSNAVIASVDEGEAVVDDDDRRQVSMAMDQGWEWRADERAAGLVTMNSDEAVDSDIELVAAAAAAAAWSSGTLTEC